jgi:hypothetical protein
VALDSALLAAFYYVLNPLFLSNALVFLSLISLAAYSAWAFLDSVFL